MWCIAGIPPEAGLPMSQNEMCLTGFFLSFQKTIVDVRLGEDGRLSDGAGVLSDLKNWEDSAAKVKEAHDAVSQLRRYITRNSRRRFNRRGTRPRRGRGLPSDSVRRPSPSRLSAASMTDWTLLRGHWANRRPVTTFRIGSTSCWISPRSRTGSRTSTRAARSTGH